MTRIARFTTLATVAALTALAALPAPALAGASPDRLVITGMLVDNAGLLPRLSTAPVTLRIDRFTSDEEAASLATVLHKSGPRGLRRELFRGRVGSIQVNNSLGYPIAFAREFGDDHGRHLLLIIERTVSPREIFRAARSVDYPYTVVEIDLDRDGRGSGDLLPAARLRVHEDGQVELVNLIDMPLRLLALRETRP